MRNIFVIDLDRFDVGDKPLLIGSNHDQSTPLNCHLCCLKPDLILLLQQ
jgi:hypothetical protein